MMGVITEGSKKLNEFTDEYPHLTVEAVGLYQLMCDEVEAGESPDNEFDLFINSLEELKEEHFK